MNYNILDNIFNYTNISTTIKLLEIYKDQELYYILGRTRLINKLFDSIAVIDVTKSAGPKFDTPPDFVTVEIYEDEDININDKILLIEIINNINTLFNKSVYCDIYYHHDNINFNKFMKIYNYMINHNIYN